MNDVVPWLLEGEPWVEYRTRIDLLGQSENMPRVVAIREAMVAHPKVQTLLEELADWSGPPLKRHNDAKHLLHKLTFVADLGLCITDPGVDAIVTRVLSHQSMEGPFQILVNIPAHFGGSGKDELNWALCDAPLIVYALAKLGLANDDRIQNAASYMAGLVRENGWPCAAAPEMGKFHGPGNRNDPCPYANLVMLKAFAQLSGWRDSDATRAAVETALDLWTIRKEHRPYLFAMGTHFNRLKAPLIWYDILHVLDVLTQFPWARDDARLQEMVRLVVEKADANGRFKPESVWMAWKGWDFGQKREPSRWLTLLVNRMLARSTSGAWSFGRQEISCVDLENTTN